MNPSPSRHRRSLSRSEEVGDAEAASVFSVFVRIRPFLAEDTASEMPFEIENNTTCVLKADPRRSGLPTQYRFDQCFPPSSPSGEPTSNAFVFQVCGLPCIEGVLEGVNCSILAYGQTNSGKTHTMSGSDADVGLIPRACQELLRQASDSNLATSSGTVRDYSVEVSYIEIYKEAVMDLLLPRQPGEATAPQHRTRKVRYHPIYGVFVEGLTYERVTSWSQCMSFFDKASKLRHVAATKLNVKSSRSHAIFELRYVQTEASALGTTQRRASLHLADLAGSERIKQSGVDGTRLRETAQINQSLTTLRRVIDALTATTRSSPPYRESMLTWILSESLGGNARSSMVATVSPSADNLDESISTLEYATKAKAITNRVHRNIDGLSKLIDQLRDSMAQSATTTPNVELTAELQLKKETIDVLVSREQEMHQRFDAMRAQLVEAQQRNVEVEEASALQRSMLTKSLADMSVRSSRQRDDIERLAAENTAMSATIASLRKEISKYKKTINTMGLERDQLKTYFSASFEVLEQWTTSAWDTLLEQNRLQTDLVMKACAVVGATEKQRTLLQDALATCTDMSRQVEQYRRLNYESQRVINSVVDRYVVIQGFLRRAEGGVFDRQWTVASILHSLNDFVRAVEATPELRRRARSAVQRPRQGLGSSPDGSL